MQTMLKNKFWHWRKPMPPQYTKMPSSEDSLFEDERREHEGQEQAPSESTRRLLTLPTAANIVIGLLILNAIGLAATFTSLVSCSCRRNGDQRLQHSKTHFPTEFRKSLYFLCQARDANC
jgi:hypothetical protein